MLTCHNETVCDSLLALTLGTASEARNRKTRQRAEHSCPPDDTKRSPMTTDDSGRKM